MCVCVGGGRGGGGAGGLCVWEGGTVLFFMFVCAYVCAPSNIVLVFLVRVCVGWGGGAWREGLSVLGGGGLCGKEGRAVSVGRGRAVCDGGGGGGCVCGGGLCMWLCV